MKTKIVIGFTALVLSTFAIGMLTGFKYAEPKQTEEYAFLVVKEWGTENIDILTTIGDAPTKTETIKMERSTDKSTSRMNYGTVLKRLNELNAKGFELITVTQAQNATSTSFVWGYMFRKRIN